MQNRGTNGNRDVLQLLISLCLSQEGDTFDLPPDVDWPFFLSLAHYYSLSPLLYLKIRQLGLWSQCPEESRKTLLHAFAINLHRTELQKRELVRITQALSRASIPVIPYKGCFLSQLLYGDPYLRVSGDIDIIIPREETKKAWDILTKEMGYEGLSPARGFVDISRTNEYNFKLGSPKGIIIEVHWEQVRAYNPLKIPMDRIWERTTPMTIWDTTFRVPEPPLHFLMLAIHAIDDGWPIKSLVDLATFHSRLSPQEWKAVETEAHQWNLPGLLKEAMERIQILRKGEWPSTEGFKSRRDYGKNIITRTLQHTSGSKRRLTYLFQALTQPSFRDYDLVPGKRKSRILATTVRPYRLFKEWLSK